MCKMLKIFITILLFYTAFRFCESKTDGFSVLRIKPKQEFHPQWEIDASIEESKFKEIFIQPFDYLGKGAQTYVFASRDGNYVIKFFRHYNKHATPFDFLPFNGIQKMVAKRARKREKDFTSYKLAFEKLKNETGLVYIHLNPTKTLKTSVTLYDKIKIQYKLSLDEFGFILQKKAKPFYPTLSKWIEEERLEDAKLAITQLVQLIKKRCSAGLFDKDPDLKTNFGFLEGAPIQIDIGRFKLKETGANEVGRVLRKLEAWLGERSPELTTYLHNEIDKETN